MNSHLFLAYVLRQMRKLEAKLSVLLCIRDLHAPQKILKMEPLRLAKIAFPAYSLDDFVSACLYLCLDARCINLHCIKNNIPF